MANTEPTPCGCRFYDAIPSDLTEEQIENGDFQSWYTGCLATTRNTFAPGHDAKLKSFLIEHGALGNEIRRTEGGVAVSDDAIGHANRHGFGHMVAAGIAKAEGKTAAKANKAKVRAERKLAESAGLVKPLSQVVADEQKAHADAEAAKVAEREQSADWDDECEHDGLTSGECPECGDELVDGSETDADEDAVTEELTVAKVGRWEYTGQLTEDGQFAYTDNKGRDKVTKKFSLI